MMTWVIKRFIEERLGSWIFNNDPVCVSQSLIFSFDDVREVKGLERRNVVRCGIGEDEEDAAEDEFVSYEDCCGVPVLLLLACQLQKKSSQQPAHAKDSSSFTNANVAQFFTRTGR